MDYAKLTYEGLDDFLKELSAAQPKAKFVFFTCFLHLWYEFR